jgi:hypothetical protein
MYTEPNQNTAYYAVFCRGRRQNTAYYAVFCRGRRWNTAYYAVFRFAPPPFTQNSLQRSVLGHVCPEQEPSNTDSYQSPMTVMISSKTHDKYMPE